MSARRASFTTKQIVRDKNKMCGLEVLLILVLMTGHFMQRECEAHEMNRYVRSVLMKKPTNDYRKLKKQEGALKLVGGFRGNYEGNVEILHDGKWGSICDDEWDITEADIVCRQLGYKAAINATMNGFFGSARRNYWMDNVFCSGKESELADCRFSGWGKSDCESTEAAGVICQTADENHRSRSSNKNIPKIKIKDAQMHRPMRIRLVGGQTRSEGRVEIKFGNSEWGSVCGDGWSLVEANVICQQLELGYASYAMHSHFFYDKKIPIVVAGVRCSDRERFFDNCFQDQTLNCPGKENNFASVVCSKRIADLVLDHEELMSSAHLEDRPLFWLQCAMEENCVAEEAYRIQREFDNWYAKTRRLLRFTAKILNAGTDDFRPIVPKHLWEWHMCHRHYHSMEVFATFDVIDERGNRVAEGHKASFCLEDNQCLPGIEPRFKCANYGDQGISVNCSDIYKYNVDCQWVDITELLPGHYTLKVAVNPEYKVGEMSFDNNAAVCQLLYAETYVRVYNCKMQRP